MPFASRSSRFGPRLPAFPVGFSALVCAGVLLFALGSAGVVRAGPPAGYYASVNAASSALLRDTLHGVIGDHQRFPYTSTATDTWDIRAGRREPGQCFGDPGRLHERQFPQERGRRRRV